ncbi:hypothetical protein V6Z11_A05G205600 [Gossypium hirsutum]
MLAGWSYRKPPKDMLAIGIDASFLGPLFVHLALQTDPQAVEFAKGRHLCFLLKSLALIITMLLHSGTGLVVITVVFNGDFKH